MDDRELIMDLLVNLIAATSLLDRYHEACAPTKRDALFKTKRADYEKAIKRGRAALKVKA